MSWRFSLPGVLQGRVLVYRVQSLKSEMAGAKPSSVGGPLHRPLNLSEQQFYCPSNLKNTGKSK